MSKPSSGSVTVKVACLSSSFRELEMCGPFEFLFNGTRCFMNLAMESALSDENRTQSLFICSDREKVGYKSSWLR